MKKCLCTFSLANAWRAKKEGVAQGVTTSDLRLCYGACSRLSDKKVNMCETTAATEDKPWYSK